MEKALKLQFYPLIILFLAASLSLPLARAASHKHHHRADAVAAYKVKSKRQRLLEARAAAHKAHVHAARLAAKRQAEWEDHQAKLRDMPRKKRLAMRRHDRRLAQQAAEIRQQRLAALHEEHLAAAKKHHLASLRAKKHGKVARTHQDNQDNQVSDTPKPSSAHQKRLARLHKAHLQYQAHLHRLYEQQAAEHNRKIAAAHAGRHNRAFAAHNARLAAHNARLAKAKAKREARLHARQQLIAQREALHNARLVKIRAAHNARLASKPSHWVASHGDDSSGDSIKFWETVAANVPVKVITVDLNDANVKVSAVMSRNGDGTSEPFRQMIDRANPNVAVTGTFFSLDNLKPVGDIVIDGSLVHFGGMGTALCITPRNKAEMVTVEWGRHHNWKHYDFVCACGPRLLHNTHIVLDPHSERFKDQHMLAPNSRIAVGITRGNKIVFVMTHKPIYLGRLAKVMRDLGASEAMNLDAGTSTGFYYNGITLARPGRRLTNMIVVYGRKDRYEKALDQLVPNSYRKASAPLASRAGAKVARN